MKLVLRKPGRIVANAEVCGTLAARDGIKTDPGCPNGQDAYDGKVVVVSRRTDFIGGGQLNEATMPTAEVSRTLNCMHEAGRVLITNSNLGHAMPTIDRRVAAGVNRQMENGGGTSWREAKDCRVQFRVVRPWADGAHRLRFGSAGEGLGRRSPSESAKGER